MKVALVYDHVTSIGGAERILTALHHLYPNAPLYTAVYNNKTTPWADQLSVNSSFMDNLPFVKQKHQLYPIIPIFAFEKMNFNTYDVVISVTSAFAKGVITSPDTLHICYCLTPTRYIWSLYQSYFKSSLLKKLTLPSVSLLRLWDRQASTRPDFLVAISETVRKRIQKYYKRQSTLIYPPVSVLKFKNKKVRRTKTKKEYFLIVSRFVSYKKIEIAIKACNRLGYSLVIVGDGPEKKNLQNIAGNTIFFTGSLTEDKLIDYYHGCRALIAVQEEDFGISMVEALSSGTPVIAYGQGGALEIVKEGVTGKFIKKQTVDDLIRALKEFAQKDYNKILCQRTAERFSEERFFRNFNTYVQNKWEVFKHT